MKVHFVSLAFAITTFMPMAMAAAPSASANSEVEATYQDVGRTLGIVPKFMRLMPKEALVGAWHEVKSVLFNEKGAIPGKYKQLIALAVAAQIPSSHLIDFQTRASEMRGASNREIQEAIAMAALTRHWSTLINGALYDESDFRKEVDGVLQHMKDHPMHAGSSSSPVLSSSTQAYDDISATFGLVPEFMRTGSPAGIAGAWKEMKELELNPDSALPGKYKELIGLAVAAQIPCRYCTYFHTKGAEMNGATKDEIREALSLAAIERHWATIFSGMRVDETTFHKEIDQMMTHMKALDKNRPSASTN